MNEEPFVAREESLRAAIGRWRRLAIALAALLAVCLVGLVALALWPRRAGADRDRGLAEPSADTQLRRAAEALREITASREMVAAVAGLRSSFADAESALLRHLLTGEAEGRARLQGGLEQVQGRAARLRELLEYPEQQERLEAVLKALQRWTDLATRLAQRQQEGDARRAETFAALRAGDDVRRALGELADAEAKLLEERTAALEALLRPKPEASRGAPPDRGES